MGADIGTVWWSAGQNSSPGCYYFLCKFVYVEFIYILTFYSYILFMIRQKDGHQKCHQYHSSWFSYLLTHFSIQSPFHSYSILKSSVFLWSIIGSFLQRNNQEIVKHCSSHLVLDTNPKINVLQWITIGTRWMVIERLYAK